VPIWVADYVLGSYGSGAIMAVSHRSSWLLHPDGCVDGRMAWVGCRSTRSLVSRRTAAGF